MPSSATSRRRCYITAVEIEGTTVFGQIEGSGTDEFGLLLAKDSPLTECVDIALQTLKDSGELDTITTDLDERLHRGTGHLPRSESSSVGAWHLP